MSGIYIKGMEMPENCYRCLFFRMVDYWNKNDEADILFRCTRTGQETWDYTGGYLPNCPLVPVPEHGDLIDRDALIKDGWLSLHKEVMRMGGYAIHELPLKNPSIPVIIPAEEEQT